MKTVFCWLIANLESQIALMIIIAILYPQISDKQENLKKIQQSYPNIQVSESTIVYFLIGCLIIAFILAVWTAIFTYRNFDEINSRRFRWSNSNVELFDIKLKYSISRFFVSMIVYCAYIAFFTYQVIK